MKSSLYSIFALLVISGCNKSVKQSPDSQQSEVSTKLHRDLNTLFTLTDAEKILGEQAHLTDSSSTTENGIYTFTCTYTATSKDPSTRRTGNVYVMLEKYADIESAQKTYSSIKLSNEEHEGIKIINDLGDEAYFHSDGENFYFILARKGEKTFRMKINKVTRTTSLKDFNNVAKSIVAAL